MQNRYYSLVTYRKGIVELHKHWEVIREKERTAHVYAHQKAAEEACRAAEQRKEDEKFFTWLSLATVKFFPSHKAMSVSTDLYSHFKKN